MQQRTNNTATSPTIHRKRVSLARIVRLEQQTNERLNQVRKAGHTNESKHIKV